MDEATGSLLTRLKKLLDVAQSAAHLVFRNISKALKAFAGDCVCILVLLNLMFLTNPR